MAVAPVKQEEPVVQAAPEVKQAVLPPEKNDQLISLLQNLSKSVANISERLTAVENRPVVASTPNPVEDVLSITKGPQENLPNPFAGVVPQALLDTAHKVLGKKFTFECVPCAEMPAFEFTVIVPPEYSELKGTMVDRRSKTIDNIQGANGVRDWCSLVKQNVVKYLGKQLPGTNLL
jgi:hypothetical protein